MSHRLSSHSQISLEHKCLVKNLSKGKNIGSIYRNFDSYCSLQSMCFVSFFKLILDETNTTSNGLGVANQQALGKLNKPYRTLNWSGSFLVKATPWHYKYFASTKWEAKILQDVLFDFEHSKSIEDKAAKIESSNSFFRCAKGEEIPTHA